MPEQVIEADFQIVNKLGLHARAAAKFVKLASTFEADIKISRNGREVNAKSIMGIMMLAAGMGSEIHIISSGTDAQQAVDSLQELVANRFGEDE